MLNKNPKSFTFKVYVLDIDFNNRKIISLDLIGIFDNYQSAEDYCRANLDLYTYNIIVNPDGFVVR